MYDYYYENTGIFLSKDDQIIRTIRSSCLNLIYSLSKYFNKNYIYWNLKDVGRVYPTHVEYVKRYYSKFYIYVNIDDVCNYANNNNVDISSATISLVSHEIFHIILGHFSKKYEKHDKKLLNIAGDLEINQLLNIKRPGIQVEDFGFKPFRDTQYYYNALMDEIEKRKEEYSNEYSSNGEYEKSESSEENIDEEKDSESNDTESYDKSESSDSSDNNDDESKDNESSDESSNDENKDDESSNNDENNSDESSNDGNTETPENIENAEFDENSDSKAASKNIQEEIINDLIPDDVEINTTTQDKLSDEDSTIDIDVNIEDIFSMENTVKDKLKDKKDKYTIEGLEQIIRKIERTENEVKITPHGRVNSYYKLNNRRKSDFILPGKKLTKSGVSKKFSTSPIVFIDVSYSTRGSVHKDLVNVAKRLKKCGATIVYYTNYIVRICQPEDMFFSEDPCGGTDIENTVTEYIESVGEFDRAYIFTDGEDRFRMLPSICDKFNVFFIQGNKTVYEKYNENSTNIW